MHPSASAAKLGAGESLSDLGERLVSGAWADNTKKQDNTVMRLFLEFARDAKRVPRIVFAAEGSTDFKRQDDMLVEFVAYMARKGLDHSTCKTYMLSLGRQFLASTGRIQISRHVRPMLAISGLERIQGEKATGVKKETRALSSELLRKGIHVMEKWTTSVGERRRMKAVVCLGVAFMMRISELIPSQGTKHFVRWSGITFTMRSKGGRAEEMTIRIPSSKKSKSPVERSIAATWSSICAVRATFEYMEGRRSEALSNENSLFCGGGGMRKLTRNQVVEIIKKITTESGEIHVDDFTSKSMRVGGVTALTEQGDVAGHVIEKHGRWSSESWKTFYQRPTKKTKEGLAKYLG